MPSSSELLPNFGKFSHDLRTSQRSASAMRLNLQVPPSAAVAGQAAGLCLALCFNLHPTGVLPALADDGTSGAAVCAPLCPWAILT